MTQYQNFGSLAAMFPMIAGVNIAGALPPQLTTLAQRAAAKSVRFVDAAPAAAATKKRKGKPRDEGDYEYQAPSSTDARDDQEETPDDPDETGEDEDESGGQKKMRGRGGKKKSEGRSEPGNKGVNLTGYHLGNTRKNALPAGGQSKSDEDLRVYIDTARNSANRIRGHSMAKKAAELHTMTGAAILQVVITDNGDATIYADPIFFRRLLSDPVFMQRIRSCVPTTASLQACLNGTYRAPDASPYTLVAGSSEPGTPQSEQTRPNQPQWEKALAAGRTPQQLVDSFIRFRVAPVSVADPLPPAVVETAGPLSIVAGDDSSDSKKQTPRKRTKRADVLETKKRIENIITVPHPAVQQLAEATVVAVPVLPLTPLASLAPQFAVPAPQPLSPRLQGVMNNWMQGCYSSQAEHNTTTLLRQQISSTNSLYYWTPPTPPTTVAAAVAPLPISFSNDAISTSAATTTADYSSLFGETLTIATSL